MKHVARGGKIAVIGAGVSGLVAARLLCRDYNVHLYEGAARLGGHAYTLEADIAGRPRSLDIGFMVYNQRTYPNFCRLLAALGVASRETDMSFSVHCERTGLEYEGSTLAGMFVQPLNLFNWSYLSMLREVLRFNEAALTTLEEECAAPSRQDALWSAATEITLGEFIRRHGFSEAFRDWYLVPLGASIWSASPRGFLDFPARFILAFLRNHGLLQVAGHPPWRTIVGGSKNYIRPLVAPFVDAVRLGAPVERVARERDRVVVTSHGVEETFDAVVFAVAAPRALRMLADPSDSEQQVLGAFAVQPNQVAVHTDERLLPDARGAWASWNYRVQREPEASVAVTYLLNRLQGHDSPAPICVTLNATERIDGAKLLRSLTMEHPLHSLASLAAQGRWEEINGGRTYYCGAYWGHGFHEDGVNSALAVGRLFDQSLDTCIAACTKVASVTNVEPALLTASNIPSF